MTFVIITLENWHETKRRCVTGTHEYFVNSLLNRKLFRFIIVTQLQNKICFSVIRNEYYDNGIRAHWYQIA